ncbi:MAG: hypothetical protein K9I94_11005 [Bacteroidales bacterium]|nr:hypothetical protein [Bacteroidales bacterium]
MINVEIPGFKRLQLEHIVLDYNGTIAEDGLVLERVKGLLNDLSNNVEIHVITADTFGRAAENLEEVKCHLTILEPDNQDMAKENYILKLGIDKVAAIGNGRNDMRMLDVATLGIGVIQREGAAFEALKNADVICYSITDALELFRNPQRLIATLRS